MDCMLPLKQAAIDILEYHTFPRRAILLHNMPSRSGPGARPPPLLQPPGEPAVPARLKQEADTAPDGWVSQGQQNQPSHRQHLPRAGEQPRKFEAEQLDEKAVQQVDGQAVLPQGGEEREPAFHAGGRHNKQEEDRAGRAAHDEQPLGPAVVQLPVWIGAQHHLCRDAAPEDQPLQRRAAGRRHGGHPRPGERGHALQPLPPQPLLPVVVAQQEPGLKGHNPGGAPLVADAGVAPHQQRQHHRSRRQHPSPPPGRAVVDRQQGGVHHQGEEVPQQPIGPGKLHMHIGIPQRVHKGGVQRLEEQIGQGQAEDIVDAVEPGEHPAQEQERRHVKGVDHRVEELPVGEPLRQLQQVPQHHQRDQQKAERIILIFPRPRIRFHLLHPLIRKPPDPARTRGFFL